MNSSLVCLNTTVRTSAVAWPPRNRRHDDPRHVSDIRPRPTIFDWAVVSPELADAPRAIEWWAP